MTSSMTGSTGLSPRSTTTGGVKEKTPSGLRKFQKFTPEAMELYKLMMSESGPDSYLARLAGGDQSMFEQMEAPAMRQFSELQGGLASRFSGMGGLGARRSSGFQNTMNQAASNFAQDLQARRQELQRQATLDLAGLRHSLLSEQPYEFYQKPEKEGFNWGGLAGATVGGIGGFFLGGPMGAVSGASAGYGIGSNISGRGGGGGGDGGGGYSFQSTPGWKPSWSGQGYQPNLLQQAQNLRV